MFHMFLEKGRVWKFGKFEAVESSTLMNSTEQKPDPQLLTPLFTALEKPGARQPASLPADSELLGPLLLDYCLK